MTRALLVVMLLVSSAAASVAAEETPIRNFAAQDSQLNQCPKIMKDPAAYEPAVVRICQKIYALLK
jgi:hypothetical protein